MIKFNFKNILFNSNNNKIRSGIKVVTSFFKKKFCFEKNLNLNIYNETHKFSIENPEKFWSIEAQKIDWFQIFDVVYEKNREINDGWFFGGKLNVCYNAIDRHIINGLGDKIALIYDSPVSNTIEKYTYKELSLKINKFAGILKSLGVEKGDRVIIYNPNIPNTMIAMLACSRLGAIHSVVFGGFASEELATRIDDCRPKVVISSSCGIEGKKIIDYKELLNKALTIAKHPPNHTIIYQRNFHRCKLSPGDLDWDELMNGPIKPFNDCVPVESNHPLYILYTSGTTGKPKGVVRDSGGHSVALRTAMDTVFQIKQEHNWWAASDFGWVVGISFGCYAPLLTGATTIIYEGKPVGTPDPGSFWRVISQHNVKAMFVAPTAIRAIKKEDPNAEYLKKYDISSLRTLYVAGERLDPPTGKWAFEKIKRPIIDNYWMTETGSPVTCAYGHNMKFGSSGMPVYGINLKILGDDKNEVDQPNVSGNICIKHPYPPGFLMTIWENNQRYFEAYLKNFPGYFQTGDAGFRDEEGFIHVMTRTDDVIKVSAHRLSTGQIEQELTSHENVAECCVIGVADDLKGEIPVGLYVLKDGTKKTPEQVENDLIQLVRNNLGAVYHFKRAINVKALPKTRSGKLLRGTLKKILNGEPYPIPATIEDVKVLHDIEALIKSQKKI